MVSIQLGASLAKTLLGVIGAPGVTLFRTLFAAIFLCALWRPWRQTWNAKQIRALAIYGACLGSMNLLFYVSIKTIPLGLAVAIEFAGPLALSLVSSRKLIDVLWVLLAAIGIYLILPQADLPQALGNTGVATQVAVTHSQAAATNPLIASATSASSSLDPRGVFFALAAGFCWALYIWFGNKASRQGPSGRVTAIGMAFAALTVLPFGMYDLGENLLTGSITSVAIFAAVPFGLGIALLSSAIPYSLEMNALHFIPMKTFGILMSLEPVVAVIMGFLLLHEKLTPLQMTSIICIVFASLGSNYTARKAQTPEGQVSGTS